ncbi:MAG: protein kinase domain-containing protein [Pirellulaceae bacterium]
MTSNDPNRQSDEQFARQLEHQHQQILEGDAEARAPDDELALDTDSRVAKAIPVLNLLEEFRQFRDQPADTRLSADGSTDHPAGPVSTDPGNPWTGQADQIGRFQIQGVVGRGGFGVVLQAHDPQLDRDVAVKIPRFDVALSDDSLKRFNREARAAAVLSHPNVVTVYESGQHGSLCFLVSEFVEGETLAKWLNRQSNPLSAEIAAELVVTLADAVQHAHSRHVLHRDIKPSNILLKQSSAQQLDESSLASSAMITDFGLARFETDLESQTQTGSLVGTPAYMAPEQTQSGRHPVDERADVYALGSVLYELMTGQPPFRHDTIVETVAAVQKAEPRALRSINPQVPQDLEAVCLKCLEKKPEDRYASAYELQQDLTAFLEDRPVKARPVTALDRGLRWTRRNPALSGALGSLAIVIIAALITTTALWLRSDYLRRQSDARQELADSRKLIADQQTQLALQKQTLADERLSDLEQAIDSIYEALKRMPEIDSNEFRQVRQELLANVNRQYTSLVNETPADAKLQRKQVDSLLKLVALKSRLDDTAGAIEIATRIAEPEGETAGATSVAELGQRIDAMILAAEAHYANKENTRGQQFLDRALQAARERFSSIASPDEQDRIDLAVALSKACRVATDQGLRTLANELAVEAIGVWETVNTGDIDDDETILDMARTFEAAAQAHSKAEKGVRGRMFSQFAADLIVDALSEETQALPDVQFDLARVYFLQAWGVIGDYDQCREILVKCQGVLDPLIEQHPTVARYRDLNLRQRYYWGLTELIKSFNAADKRKHQLRAQEEFQRNVNLADELMLRFPDDFDDIQNAKLTSWEMLGSVTGQIGDTDKGIKILEDVLEVHTDLYERTGNQTNLVRIDAVQGNMAELLILAGEYELAIEKLEIKNAGLLEILESDPQAGQVERYLSNGYIQLSRAHAGLEQHDEALASFQLAKQHRKFEPVVSMFGEESVYLVKLGRFDDARQQFEAFANHCLDELEQQRIVNQGVSILDSIQSSDEAEDTAAVDLRSFVATAAIAVLDELQDSDEESFNALMSSDKLDPLRQTPEFEQWNSESGGGP